MPHRDVVRAQVILMVADGTPLAAISRKVGLARRIVRKWAARFARDRFRGLEAKVLAFIDERNEVAHPFNWTAASFDKILRRADGWRPRERHWTDDLKAAA
jgi:transposase